MEGGIRAVDADTQVAFPEEIIARAVDTETRPKWLQGFHKGVMRKDQAPYYRFLYEYARQRRPMVILELGAGGGASSTHFAAGNPDATVISVDITMAKVLPAARQHGIIFIEGDSLAMVPEVLRQLPSPIELLFIDSLHRYDHAMAEFKAYGPSCAPGALQLFDDVDYRVENITRRRMMLNKFTTPAQLSADMLRLWKDLPEPKRLSNELHPGSGFGMRIAP
jgi:predicted O-methyltransferase YrrM